MTNGDGPSCGFAMIWLASPRFKLLLLAQAAYFISVAHVVRKQSVNLDESTTASFDQYQIWTLISSHHILMKSVC